MTKLDAGTAVITGAGSGIGRALAEQAASAGMTVVAVDVEQPAVAETVQRIIAAGGTAEARIVDVSDAEQVDGLAASVDDVRLLCNNAGVFSGGVLWERTDVDWEWVLGVNLYGIINAIRAFVPRLIEAGTPAHIVNTASMGGLITNAYSGPYYTSKFAAVGLTECLAHDLATIEAPIGVSLLVPSLIATNIGTSDRNRPERLIDATLDDPPADAAFVQEALRSSTADGLAPAEVAALVFAAVEGDEFYIPTKPSYDRQITERHEDMLARRLPRSPELD